MMEVIPKSMNLDFIHDQPITVGGFEGSKIEVESKLKLSFEIAATELLRALKERDGNDSVFFEMELPKNFLGTVNSPKLETSVDYLNQAIKEQGSRAVVYDSPEGERSMGKVIEMFNILYDKDLTEVEGWQFMVLLKMVRASQGNFKADNYVDQASYSSLAGEADGTSKI